MDLGNQLLDVSKGLSGVWHVIFSLAGAFLASCLVIEIAPIKWNPIKAIFGLFSRGFKVWFAEVIDSSLDKQLKKVQEENKKRDEAIIKMDGAIEGLTEKVDNITNRIDQNEERAQANHISAIRRSILTFGNQIRGGMDASKESFDDIIEQYDEYKKYVKAKEISNGKMDLTIKLITNRYDELFNHVPDEFKES